MDGAKSRNFSQTHKKNIAQNRLYGVLRRSRYHRSKKKIMR